MTAPERVNLYRETYGIDPDTGNPLPGEGPTEYVRADLYDAAVAERDEARAALAKATCQRDEAREEMRRAGDLECCWQEPDGTPYCAHEQFCVGCSLRMMHELERKLAAERDEAVRLLAEAVEARDEAMREAETLERERDAARAGVERLLPVVEAAEAEALALRLKVARLESPRATEAEARAQQARSLAGVTRKPHPEDEAGCAEGMRQAERGEGVSGDDALEQLKWMIENCEGP